MNTISESSEVQTAPATITTTLYDLVAAMHTVTSPDEDDLVIATVMHWLHSGRITWLKNS